MKKIFSLVLVASALVAILASCARKEPVPVDLLPGGRTLTIVCAPGSEDSRTGINDLTPVWASGDALWVSDGVNSARVNVPEEFVGKDFAELTIPGSLRSDTTLWFLYPYDEEATVSSGKIIASIPVVQDGTFGTAHLAVGSCEASETSVALKNASAMLKMTIDREDLRVMQVTNNTAFSGSFKLTPSTGARYSNNGTFSLKTIAMTFSGKGDKYLSCMAASMAKGTHFTFITHDGRIGWITTSSANSLANGSLYDLGDLDERIVFDETPAVTLGTEETANCYIIQAPGSYRLPVVQGNSSSFVGEPAYGELLWETVNTTSAPTKYSVVSDVAFCDGYLYFHVPDEIKAGNALIGVCDASGTMLWSWHIWLLPNGYDDQTLAEAGSHPFSGAVIMDRNLGALSATPGEATAGGLLYQWGRKDPFPGVASGTSTAVKVTGTSTTTIAQTTDNGTVEFAIANPTRFVYLSSSDWLATADNTLWSAAAKTVFDPCPAGYHIPFSSALQGFSADNVAWDATAKGRKITINGQTIWFPAQGTRSSSGSLQNGGTTSYLWFDKNTTAGQNAWKAASDTMGIAPKQQPQSAGFALRCQKYAVSGDEQTLTVTLTAEAGGTYISPYLTADAYATARVFWGDGASEALGLETFLNHLYSAAGNYSLIVKGYSLSGFQINHLGDVSAIDVSGF